MGRILQYALFFGLAIAVLAGFHTLLYRRLIHDTELPRRWRRVGAWALILLCLSLPLCMGLSRILPFEVSRVALFLPFTWMGMLLHLAVFLLATDLLRLLTFLGLRIGGRAELLSRPRVRRIRARGVAMVVGLGALVLAIISVHNAAAPPAIVPARVELAKLPPELSGFKIALLTDLHLGPILGGEWLADVVARTNALEPDLVAIVGDLVDGSPELLREVVEPLRDLRARHGVFFVTGNHEYYSGVEAWLPALERLGIRVLQNERVAIAAGEGGGFDLAGVSDYEGRRFGPEHAADLPRALAGRDPARALVLLAHQAKAVAEAAALGVDLQLSGHNHGGQIWPWMWVVGLVQPFVHGLHHQAETAIYISAGTGFWGPPMRLGTQSEIGLIELAIPGV